VPSHSNRAAHQPVPVFRHKCKLGTPLRLSLHDTADHVVRMSAKTPPLIGTQPRLMVEGTDCLGVAAAPAYRKPWIAFARQKFTRSGFDECSNHLN
jgi:hypothetical protein